MCAALILGSAGSDPFAASTASREVAYDTPDGFRVLADYYRPDTASSGAVLILPDPSEGKGAWSAVADSVRAAGYHVLVPDLRGTGGSVNQRGVRRDRARFTRTEMANGKLDARAGMDYLRNLPTTAIRDVVLVGSGKGAASLPGSRGDGFESVSYVLISPFPDQEGAGWTKKAREISGMMLIVVANDDLLGIDAAAAVAPDDPSRECWLIQGSGRGAELLGSRKDLIHVLIGWIRNSFAS